MTDLFATTLGLVFTLVVCLVAVHALLGPWLRPRQTRADSPARSSDEKRVPRTAATRDAAPV
jgi:hypothetical protein